MTGSEIITTDPPFGVYLWGWNGKWSRNASYLGQPGVWLPIDDKSVAQFKAALEADGLAPEIAGRVLRTLGVGFPHQESAT